MMDQNCTKVIQPQTLNEKSETAGAGAKICVSGWARSYC